VHAFRNQKSGAQADRHHESRQGSSSKIVRSSMDKLNEMKQTEKGRQPYRLLAYCY
jgi:hypothetical protein